MFGEAYHSQRGAVGEARHVFIACGFNYELGIRNYESANAIKVLEMGFGSGLNCWLTLLEAERTGVSVEYVGVEKYPVAPEVARKLGYAEVSGDGSGDDSDPRFGALHTAPWGSWTQISPTFRLLKLRGDLTEILASPQVDLRSEQPSGKARDERNEGAYTDVRDRATNERNAASGLLSPQIVYWDAFSPETQPELWTPELFGRIYAAMAPGGVLVTYSAKGDVRRALQAAGFAVEKLPGALGKRHMLRAKKNYEL